MSRKKKSKTGGQKLTAALLQGEVLKLFKREPKKRLNAKQVIKKLKIDNNKDAVQDALTKLEKEGKLYSFGEGTFRLDRTQQFEGDRITHKGRVDMTRGGAAFIVCDDLDQDIYVPAKYINSALHGDRVEVSAFTARKGRRPEGEVLSVVERATEIFIGTFRLSKKYAIIIPDRINMPIDIFIDLKDTKEAKDGEKVVVKIKKWHNNKNHSPIGEVTAVLGAVGSHDIEMKSILISNGFNLDFPEEAQQESEAISVEISAEEVARRRDMRNVTTFTIDPDTAKDFDDALSIRYLENGNTEIGVHIADVSHYVKPNTALDQEAFSRSTSVYLVDRVLPMLPEKISNELCSLRPNEDKYTFSAVFEFDKKDKIVNHWFGKTVTHSNRRFTYEDAQEVLDTGEGDFAEELKEMDRLAKVLRKQKFKDGAIAFEADEVKFKLNEEGDPIDVFVKERKDTNLLIEDFMLLANREVATFISHKGKDNGAEIPFVYRVHDLPNEDKVKELALFAKELDFEININTPRAIAESYNKLAKAARKDPILKMLEPIAIRTMSKAAYTTNNIGHYGLGFAYYSHFTSPIRRYSDVLVHRILEWNLDEIKRVRKEVLEEKCKYISLQERKAMAAERESVKYKQVQFMEDHVGKEFNGIISGMIDRGIFVELEHIKAEGLIGFEKLGDSFDLGEGRLKAVGVRTKKVYKMGDTVRVRIISTDLAKRQIEMEVVPTGSDGV
ncbi:MAG: ribonuclease R [Saprospiraceae bacterium]|jgi:ribonuclease R